MNIGQKIQLLKDSMGFRNYQEFGKAVGLSGDWLVDLSKKEAITMVDITRLIKIADYANITLDNLLKDNKEWTIDIKEGLPEDDIGIMLDNINNRLNNKNNKFYGYSMNNEAVKLTQDTIDEVKKLIKENL